MQRILLPPTKEEVKTRLFAMGFHFADVELIMRAWDWNVKWHSSQKRESGESYDSHPQIVMWILILLGVTDTEMLCVALLHDILEIKKPYPKPTFGELRRAFGRHIAVLVRAVTKQENQDVAAFTKQVFAGGPKAVIPKFADRLHNLWTLNVCDKDKQKRTVVDTLLYYLPDSGMYKKFFSTVLPKEERMVNRLWGLMVKAIDDLGVLATS